MNKEEKISSLFLSDSYEGRNKHTYSSDNPTRDWLDRFKNKIKIQFPNLYVWLIKIVSPVYDVCSPKKFLSQYDMKSDVILNVGAGTFCYHKEIINLDIRKYDSVDIVGDITTLDMLENSVDAIVNIAMLEHVPNPADFVKKFHYVLKKGGKAFIFIPFMQGYHASPDDYQRYTFEGIKNLCSEFSIEKLIVGGPTSGLLWVLQEWLSLFFSFGSVRLYKIIFPLFYILSPLKVIDAILSKHPYAKNIATGFTIIIKKE